MSSLKIEIEGRVARLLPGGGAPPQEMPLADLLDGVSLRRARKPASSVLPDGVRAWRERGDAVALAIEIPAGIRTLRWIRDDARFGYGDDSLYELRRLSLPYLIVLAVFAQGHLTSAHQLFYRTAPLSVGEDLFLPNLLNVAPSAHGMQAWVCLLNLSIPRRASWHERVHAIVEHVLATGWNHSANFNEGKSYFGEMRDLDPRISSVTAWENASRANPSFALDVPWRSAKTTLTEELERMLDMVSPAMSIDSADDLAGLAVGTRRGGRRRRRLAWFL